LSNLVPFSRIFISTTQHPVSTVGRLTQGLDSSEFKSFISCLPVESSEVTIDLCNGYAGTVDYMNRCVLSRLWLAVEGELGFV
ncbi:hypothetical protein KEJ39_09130, partial [Candidatus Bathyarchaeota archaeon]|nr:hypothetical protein [Candidatus Bathyarchaeota archaeon]